MQPHPFNEDCNIMYAQPEGLGFQLIIALVVLKSHMQGDHSRGRIDLMHLVKYRFLVQDERSLQLASLKHQIDG